MTTASQLAVLNAVAARAGQSGVFGEVEIRDNMVSCRAAASAAPAAYRLERDADGWFVSLVTADRWLSQSIEQDLVHTGDKIPDLLEEELVNLDCPAKPSFSHYRSEDKLFTFRTPVPPESDESALVRTATAFLLAYEACFRNLGDMSAGEEEDE